MDRQATRNAQTSWPPPPARLSHWPFARRTRRPDTMKAAIRQIVGEAAMKPGRVKLDLPPLVENGNTVAMTVSVESPMTAKDYVKAIHVFTEKNPQPNVISVQLGPRAGKAEIATRIRLADTQTVIAICEMSDGSFWSDKRRRHHHARRLPGGPGLMAARTLINVPAEGQARRGHRDQDADLAHHGDRLPPRQRRAARSRATSSRRSAARYNGEKIFEAALYPAIAANPFITFYTVATESGTIAFQWTGDNGFTAGRLRENHRRMSRLARLLAAAAWLPLALPSLGR